MECARRPEMQPGPCFWIDYFSMLLSESDGFTGRGFKREAALKSKFVLDKRLFATKNTELQSRYTQT